MRRMTLLTVAAAALGLGGCGVNLSHGDGDKIGQVIKLSKQGLFVDTWEGQIIRGGMSDGSGGFGVQPFDFTVESDELAAKVRGFMETQAEVVIKYRIEGVYSPFRSERSGPFLVSIEPAKKPTHAKEPPTPNI